MIFLRIWFITITAAVLLTACASPGTPGPGNIQARIERLEYRINQGVSSGELTRPEAARAKTRLDAIRDKRARFRRDGRLGPRERRILLDDLNTLENRIFRMKHNPARRY